VLVSGKTKQKENRSAEPGAPFFPPGSPPKVTKNYSRVGRETARKGKNRKLFDEDDNDTEAEQEPEAGEEEDVQICAKLEAAFVDNAKPNKAANGKAADGEEKAVAAKVEPGRMDDEPDRVEA
jgi:hypothetical protein